MKRAVLVAAVLAVLRVPLTAALDLAPDEAYYWTWAQRLDWSYFDHAPMVAWLIAAATAVFGDAPWAVRIPALLAGFVVPVALAWTAHVLAPPERKERAAFLTALLAGAMPALHAAGVIVTPDSPQAVFWSLTLAALASALFEGRTVGWYFAGVTLGCGLLSKYTTVTLGGSLALLAFLDADTRRMLRTPHPWFAAVISVALFLPVIHWNREHEWVSFAFQLGHGTTQGGGARVFVEFLFAQIAILTPMLAVLVAVHVWKGGTAATKQGDRFLTAAIVPTAAFFAFMAARSRPEANWPAMAWLGAAVVGGLASAKAADSRGAGWDATTRKLYRATVVVGFAATAILSVHAVSPLVTIRRDRFVREFRGWQERTDAAIAAAGPGGVILGDGYQMASEVAYHCERRASCRLESIGVARKKRDRPSMYDLWTAPVIASGGNAAWIAARRRKLPADVAPLFKRSEAVPLPDGVKGTLWRLEGYRGEGWPLVRVAQSADAKGAL